VFQIVRFFLSNSGLFYEKLNGYVEKIFRASTPVAQEEDGFTQQQSYNTSGTDTKIEVNRYSLLIVEDNSDMMAYLKHALSETYNLFCAKNGKAAMEKLATMPAPHLIVSDIMMDVMDGYEFYEEFKKNGSNDAIPFIFLTAKNTQIEKVKALQKGAIDFIPKPFEIEELKAKIKSIIETTQAQKESSKQQLIRRVIDTLNGGSDGSDFSLLFEKQCSEADISQREKQIIFLLLKGKQYKEIADELYISMNTVNSHIRNIYKKCCVNNRLELSNYFSSQ
jgi:DNA-binding NarL/FixJ family response regulator